MENFASCINPITMVVNFDGDCELGRRDCDFDGDCEQGRCDGDFDGDCEQGRCDGDFDSDCELGRHVTVTLMVTVNLADM